MDIDLSLSIKRFAYWITVFVSNDILTDTYFRREALIKHSTYRDEALRRHIQFLIMCSKYYATIEYDKKRLHSSANILC